MSWLLSALGPHLQNKASALRGPLGLSPGESGSRHPPPLLLRKLLADVPHQNEVRRAGGEWGSHTGPHPPGRAESTFKGTRSGGWRHCRSVRPPRYGGCHRDVSGSPAGGGSCLRSVANVTSVKHGEAVRRVRSRVPRHDGVGFWDLVLRGPRHRVSIAEAPHGRGRSRPPHTRAASLDRLSPPTPAPGDVRPEGK